MTALLEVRGLSGGYVTGALTVSDISLSVEPGQVVTVLGANGAGKTTLLRIIAGELAVRGGEIVFAGQGIGALGTPRRVAAGLALVPQGHQLYGGLTVLENLRMGAFLRSRRPDLDAALARVFDLFPVLGERLHQTASSLSGGERAMLAVGRGLVSRPRLLMLDEPSIGLAPLVRETMFAALSRLCDEDGMAMLMAEQDVPSALAISDEVYALQGGVIVASGDPASFEDDALNAIYLGVAA
jgi:branched-chain amino acid transport system ATP-binding protein